MRLASRARLTRRASRDLASIWHWVRKDSGRSRAQTILRAFATATDRLVDLPELGTARPHYGEGLRCLVVRPYLIFYRKEAGGVTIVRIIDGRRDLEALFDNET